MIKYFHGIIWIVGKALTGVDPNLIILNSLSRVCLLPSRSDCTACICGNCTSLSVLAPLFHVSLSLTHLCVFCWHVCSGTLYNWFDSVIFQNGYCLCFAVPHMCPWALILSCYLSMSLLKYPCFGAYCCNRTSSFMYWSFVSSNNNLPLREMLGLQL